MSSSYLIDGKWMSIRDFSLKYELPLRTAQRYAEEGHLPAKKMGARGSWYVNMELWNKKVEIYKQHEEETPNVVDFEGGGFRKTKGV